MSAVVTVTYIDKGYEYIRNIVEVNHKGEFDGLILTSEDGVTTVIMSHIIKKYTISESKK